MEFRRNAQINAPLDQVWALTEDIPAVAGCIPGVADLDLKGPQEFDCVISQRVGSVKSKFNLHTVISDLDARKSLTLVSSGQDRSLGSNVKANLKFGLSEKGEATEVDIVADFQVTGRIATFGHRIIAAKAEQVVMEALRNVDQLLAERRGSAGA
jgi:carbon monoxide dehydrogenase subunit G